VKYEQGGKAILHVLHSYFTRTSTVLHWTSAVLQPYFDCTSLVLHSYFKMLTAV
jgi:hypothetical protein